MDSAHYWAAGNSLADKTQTTKEAFEGNMCLKNVTKMSKLKPSGDKPFQCDTCLMKFSKKRGLSRHIKGHSNEKPFECEMCQKKFNDKMNLIRHMRVHTGEKPFGCDMCRKRFNDKSNLVRHVKMHTGGTTFQCIVCEKNFSQKSHLTEHDHRVHSGTYRVRCDICTKSVGRSYLQKHRKLHSDEKTLQCIICQVTFTLKCNLLRQIKLHTGERPFKCDFCQQQIFSKSDLTRYIEEHTGEKPFQCDSCLKECGLKIDVTDAAAVEDGSNGNISEKQMKTSVHNEFGDGVEAKVKVENVEDTFSPTDSTIVNVEKDCKIEIVHPDLERDLDIPEYIVKIKKNWEEDNNQ